MQFSLVLILAIVALIWNILSLIPRFQPQPPNWLLFWVTTVCWLAFNPAVSAS